MRTWSIILAASLIFCSFTASSEAQTNGGGAVLDNISSQFTTSTKKWETTIKGHAVTLFWILAAIAAVWTFILLVLRQADLAELFGAVTRFTFVTFFFYWILQNGGEFAAKIMQSTQQIGNDATGANGLDWGAFVQAGIDILLGVNGKISVWEPITGLWRPSPGFADPDCSVSDQPEHYPCYCADVDHRLLRVNLSWVRRCGVDQGYVGRVL